MNKHKPGKAFALVMFILVCARVASAQQASLTGRVTDKSEAVVAGASVKVTNLDTGITRQSESNSEGFFTVPFLPPGAYRVTVEANGFKTSTRDGLQLTLDQVTRADFALEPGAVTETVQVTAEAPVLQTDSATLGTAITGKLVQDLPLNGRNYVQLALLAPGVSSGPPNGLATGTRPDDRRLNSSYSVNGQDPIVNNNMIDGMDNNERVIGTIGVRPSIDAIQEFKVQTNLYNAEIGRTSGGVVNILTKSGTNSFHGSAFEFLRNDKFDANGNYNFTGGAQLPRQKLRLNQFGGSLGGPIIKNRTFFFGDYEGLKIRQGIPITAVVPTAKQRLGDFSENCSAGFNAAGICANAAQQLSFVNPIGGAPAGAVPFNRLDLAPYAALRDPLGLKLAALYPLPTGPGINTTNYASSPVRPQDASTFDARIDHRFSPNWNFFGRYSFNDVTTIQPTGFPTVNGVNPGGLFAFAGPNETRAQNLQLNLVYTLRPNLLLELKAGYLRTAIQSKTVNDGKNSANDLGFPCNAVSCVNVGDIQTFGLPRLLPQGFNDLGDATFVPLLNFNNTYQYTGALTWTRGAHNIKFGGLLMRRQYSQVQSASARGVFTFNATTTNAPAPLNFGFANFVLGAPVTIVRSATLYKPGYRAWESGFYAQDDWRVNNWLTLNLGLRYDIFTPKTEAYNRLSNFDPAPARVLIAGENSNAAVGVTTDYGAIAPRFGFAATLGHGMVLRGGVGWSYFPGDYASNGLLKNPPFTAALTCGSSTTGSLTNTGCPAGTGTLAQGPPRPLEPSGFARANGTLDLTKIPPSSFGAAIELNYQASYYLQFNLTLEKQFGNNVVSVGYVGTKGYDLPMGLGDLNRALPSGAATPNPRPFAAIAPRVATISYLASQGNASYNSLQMSFNRRFSKGLSVTSGFTWAHGVDEITGLGTSTGGYGNLIGPDLSQAIANVKKYDRATSDFNIKFRWSFGANYELPWGKNLKGAAGQALGGWQVNGSAIWQTGLPFTVTDQQAVSGIIGGGAERPNRVAQNLRVANPTVGVAGQFLDPAAFALPAPFTLGNATRNVGYGPNQSVVNLSFFKTFKLTEVFNLQFRTEVFNLPNHPVFGNPNTSFGNANYGKITTTAGTYTPRQIQFALKLLF
ncbi:MAG: TonB-dependent receptor domain-containing protein [Blastocatellia bacterium]